MHPYLRLHLLLTATGVRRPASASGTRIRRPLRRDLPVGTPMLRRVLGRVLVETFCPFGTPLCQRQESTCEEGLVAPVHRCSAALSCPYGVLYAASRSARPPFALDLSTGARVKIDLVEVTLLGQSWTLYPWVLSSLQRALQDGLGRQRRSFEIDAVIRVDAYEQREQLCAGDLGELPSALEPDMVGISVEPFAADSLVEVELLSPLRLVHTSGRPELGSRSGLPFHTLVSHVLDRYQAVFPEDTSDILEPDVRDTIRVEAAQVRLISDQTRWVEIPDHAARSRRHQHLGGWIGKLVYGGGAARFLSILRAGEILHVGRNASSGCGARLSSSPSSSAAAPSSSSRASAKWTSPFRCFSARRAISSLAGCSASQPSPLASSLSISSRSIQ